jgi:hypothetical protein
MEGAMFPTGSITLDAEQAFNRAARSRRRAALLRRLRGDDGCGDGRLPVHLGRAPATATSRPAIREIPLDAIRGTLEPSRAELFDCGFRPSAKVRARWQRLWSAEVRGAVLPPISVVDVGDGYVVRDGHHRVSVARARGALMIDATVV